MDYPSVPQIIPIVLTSNLVFFPDVHLCLHVPLPFYNRLKQSALPEDCFVGVVLHTQRSSEKPILPIGCVGMVVRSHPLPCGQAVHLDLHGLKRFRVRERWVQEGFSQGSIEILEDPPGNLSPERKRALLEALRYLSQMKESTPELGVYFKENPADEVLLHHLCFESDLSPTEKYFLLEAEDLNQRCGRLLDLLRFRMEDILSNRGTCQKDR